MARKQVVLIESLNFEDYVEADMRRWWMNRCTKIMRDGEIFFDVQTPDHNNRARLRESVKRLASFGIRARVALREVT